MRKIIYKRLLVTLVALTALGTAAVIYWTQYRTIQFSSERWKAASQTRGERARMVDDLVRNHLKRGMSKGEVVSLLDLPTADRYGDSLVYVVAGYARQWPFRNWAALWLSFDEQGHLEIFEVRTD